MTTFPSGPFGTIVADPPWAYKSPGSYAAPKSDTGLSGKASAANRYGLMSLADIKALPVADCAGDSAHLYLWTTNSFMVEAHEVVRSWGFDHKTILTYGKVKADGTPSMKMGYYFRGATEHVLFATRGKTRRLRSDVGLSTLMLGRRLPHSVKPDWFYSMVEAVSPSPRLDIFARRFRDGWQSWGDELSQPSAVAA